ncbi:hypothetical protein KC315_g1449 [Hortaea werneckii]|nr:hypothetical protein KC315_g1449 [Hortaea werneckii]KAI7371377.1 hypothetical protein KC354_g609 [Hortaea werneckii]KAI7546691.1 hypothetical protein KC331_g5462 [Hortaea werneckii]KAI7718813.1 hypothetical protein KC353_g3486 [Hortaea werneckii]
MVITQESAKMGSMLRTLQSTSKARSSYRECLDEAASLGVQQDDIVPLNVQPQAFVQNSGPSNANDIVLDFVGKHQTFQGAQHIVRGRHGVFGHDNHTADIDFQSCSPLLEVNVDGRAGRPCDSDIVDQNVKPAKTVQRVLNCSSAV